MKKKGRNKKAQAAMEFLTTYGWAILILLIVIVALANLGVFKAKGSVSACIPVGPFSACDINLRTCPGGICPVNGNGISIKYSPDIVTSPVGVRLSGASIVVGSGAPACTAPSGLATTADLISGTSTTFTCDTNPGTAGSTYSGSITINYVSSAGLTKAVTMTVGGTILP